MLAMRIEEKTYALPTRSIHEVVPLVTLRAVPRAPACIAGTFNYRGRIVPVIDLAELLAGRPCRLRLDTRIVVVQHPASEEGLLGLMAEGVTETLDIDPASEAAGATVRSAETPYLGPVVQHEVGQVQLFDVGALFGSGHRHPQIPAALGPAQDD